MFAAAKTEFSAMARTGEPERNTIARRGIFVRGPQSRQQPFLMSILLLIGHLCATALVFISLFTLGWGVAVAVAFAFLQSVHAFPDQVFDLVSRLELGLIYLDAAVCGVVLMVGIVRFVRDVLERK
jgi:hypothetical protein